MTRLYKFISYVLLSISTLQHACRTYKPCHLNRWMDHRYIYMYMLHVYHFLPQVEHADQITCYLCHWRCYIILITHTHVSNQMALKHTAIFCKRIICLGVNVCVPVSKTGSASEMMLDRSKTESRIEEISMKNNERRRKTFWHFVSSWFWLKYIYYRHQMVENEHPRIFVKKMYSSQTSARRHRWRMYTQADSRRREVPPI